MAQYFAYVMCSGRAEAERLATRLLEDRLIACANLIDGVTSLYRWEEEIRQDGEAALILKTREEVLPELIATIRELHTYNCPCIAAWPITAGNPDFLRWIDAETATCTTPPPDTQQRTPPADSV